jgi:hypothetical protein
MLQAKTTKKWGFILQCPDRLCGSSHTANGCRESKADQPFASTAKTENVPSSNPTFIHGVAVDQAQEQLHGLTLLSAQTIQHPTAV